jgi:hypothetical protein
MIRHRLSIRAGLACAICAPDDKINEGRAAPRSKIDCRAESIRGPAPEHLARLAHICVATDIAADYNEAGNGCGDRESDIVKSID